MALSADKFSEALSPQAYIEQMKVNRAPFEAIYESIEIPGEVQEFFDGLSEPVNLAVFHAEWCGDAVSTTPAILRLAESSGKINVGVFNRDEEVDLTNTFVPEHRANTVPVFVVLDREMGEIARFIETARSLVPQIDAMDDSIAAEVAQEADAQADNARALTRGKRTAFRVSHGKEWGQVILQEFRQVVSDGLALPAGERPAEGGTEWPVPEN
jgi:thiol-disulfide isomerase/thioredoxin